MTSEQPSEEMSVRLSINTSHCNFWRKEAQHEKARQGKRLQYQLKIDFLTCHIKDHPGLPDGDRHLTGGRRGGQTLQAASVSQHREQEPPFPLGLGTVPLPMTCSFADCA